MDYDLEERMEMVRDFVNEARELLDDAEPQIIDMEKTALGSGRVDEEILNAIFRLFHSLKGTASFLDFQAIIGVTHEAETLLDIFRKGKAEITPYHVDLLCRTSDFVRGILDVLEQRFSDEGFEEEAESLINDLKQTIAAISGEDAFTGRDESASGYAEGDAPCDQLFYEADGEDAPAPDKVDVLQPKQEHVPWSAPEEIGFRITPEMIKNFSEESLELCEEAESALLALERVPDAESAGQVFRAFHSIKGNAGFFGYGDLERLSHLAENVLDQIRNGERVCDPASMSVLLKVIDVIRSKMSDLSPEDTGEMMDIDQLCDMLMRLESQEAEAAPEPEPQGTDHDNSLASHLDSDPQAEPLLEKAPFGYLLAGGVLPEKDLQEELEQLEAENGTPGNGSAGRPDEGASGSAGQVQEPPTLEEEIQKLAIITKKPEAGRPPKRARQKPVKTFSIPDVERTYPSRAERTTPDPASQESTASGEFSAMRAQVEQGLKAIIEGMQSSHAVSDLRPPTDLGSQDQEEPNLKIIESEAPHSFLESSDLRPPTDLGSQDQEEPNLKIIESEAPHSFLDYSPAAQGNEAQPAPGKQARGIKPNVSPSLKNAEDADDRTWDGTWRTEGAIQVQRGAAVVSTPGIAAGASAVIRVDIDKLDKMLDLVGELVIAESMVFNNQDLNILKNERFGKSVMQLNKISREIQEVAMSMRMIPLAGVFRKMMRLVRDLAQKANKQVELQIIGEETEVDKTIIEQISDPLVHLIRNAVDHGLETPAQRLAAGKPEAGRVTLEAKHSAGEVWITIEDDGRGLDRDKIFRKGVEKGLVKIEDREMKDEDVWRLIFEPGFSTADQVSSISGRGVGMDVVKRNIERLRGKVDIRSKPGVGTMFAVRIPLTLAIIEGMVVRVGAHRYTIPISSIKESFRPANGQITSTPDGMEIVRIRGELQPVLRLHELYGVLPRFYQLSEGILIMVENSDNKCCLFVDELLGQQQIVIKGLPGYLSRVQGVSGCAILGDGEISLILDIAGLISSVAEVVH
jgi:two-component system chemotaxis sensor kinase CheA